MKDLLPRARLRDVIAGRAYFVGTRLDPSSRRGVVSPIEARLLLGADYGNLAAEEERYLRKRSFGSDLGVLARWCIARAVAPRRDLAAKEHVWVVSARLDNLALDEALDRIFSATPAQRGRVVHFAHAHSLNLAVRDPELASCLSRADLTLPDGVGIRIGAGLLGVQIRQNLNGTDLWPFLVERSVREGQSLALIGAAPGVAEACAERIRQEFPAARIAVVADGFEQVREPTELVSRIRSAAPCLVLVGMGSPRQELWVWQHLAREPRVTTVTVGGLFDFISQRVPRAPQAWRDLGLEWAYRMLQEPGRLWRRYLVGNFVFLFRVLRQRWRTQAPAAGR